jgi:hypothetical protein
MPRIRGSFPIVVIQKNYTGDSLNPLRSWK